MNITIKEAALLNKISKGMDEPNCGWSAEVVGDTRSDAAVLGSLIKKELATSYVPDEDYPNAYWVELTNKGIAEQKKLSLEPTKAKSKTKTKTTLKTMSDETKTTEAAVAEKVTQNGITVPKDGSIMKECWDAIENLSAKKGSPALRQESLEACDELGAKRGTSAIVYGRWRTFYGLKGRLKDPAVEAKKAEAAAAKKAAAKEREEARKVKAKEVAEAKKAKAAEAKAKAAEKKKAAAEKKKADAEAAKAKKAAAAEKVKAAAAKKKAEAAKKK